MYLMHPQISLPLTANMGDPTIPKTGFQLVRIHLRTSGMVALLPYMSIPIR